MVTNEDGKREKASRIVLSEDVETARLKDGAKDNPNRVLVLQLGRI